RRDLPRRAGAGRQRERLTRWAPDLPSPADDPTRGRAKGSAAGENAVNANVVRLDGAVEAWPALSEAIRRAVLALVATAAAPDTPRHPIRTTSSRQRAAVRPRNSRCPKRLGGLLKHSSRATA